MLVDELSRSEAFGSDILPILACVGLLEKDGELDGARRALPPDAEAAYPT